MISTPGNAERYTVLIRMYSTHMAKISRNIMVEQAHSSTKGERKFEDAIQLTFTKEEAPLKRRKSYNKDKVVKRV